MAEDKDKPRYDVREEPKIRVSMTLTQTALAALDAEARQKGATRSGLVERYARMLQQEPVEEQLLGEFLGS